MNPYFFWRHGSLAQNVGAAAAVALAILTEASVTITAEDGTVLTTES